MMRICAIACAELQPLIAQFPCVLTVEQVIRATIEASEHKSVTRFAVDALGESRDWLTNRLLGRTKLEPQDVERIRVALGQTQGWPYTDSRLGRPLEGLPLAPIPVVGSAHAGGGDISIEEQDPLYVPANMAGEDRRGLIIEGDSMVPHLAPGDIAVFRESKIPKYGRVNLLRDPDQRPRVKELRMKDGRIVAHSYNPEYPDEPALGTVEGFLVGMYRIDGSEEVYRLNPNGLRFFDT